MSLTTSDDSSTIKPRQQLVKQIEINERKGYLFTKRVLDILGSISGILILSFVFLIITICIKLEDREGPIFFRQLRVGKDGKPFIIYKFRSMVSDAEYLKPFLLKHNEATGPVFKMKHDPRVTKVGRFIRKTSLDELPQLFNVLKGEMSLVGPRPPLLEEVVHYSNYEKQRLRGTPGLTCYWQVSGRSNIGFEQWVEMDLKYLYERNLLIDIKLILKTLLVLFGSKDAY